jgi:hypothetical protein
MKIDLSTDKKTVTWSGLIKKVSKSLQYPIIEYCVTGNGKVFAIVDPMEVDGNMNVLVFSKYGESTKKLESPYFKDEIKYFSAVEVDSDEKVTLYFSGEKYEYRVRYDPVTNKYLEKSTCR